MDHFSSLMLHFQYKQGKGFKIFQSPFCGFVITFFSQLVRIGSRNIFFAESNVYAGLQEFFPTLLILFGAVNVCYLSSNMCLYHLIAKPSYVGYNMCVTALKPHIKKWPHRGHGDGWQNSIPISVDIIQKKQLDPPILQLASKYLMSISKFLVQCLLPFISFALQVQQASFFLINVR